MSIAELIPDISGAALDGVRTKASLVALLAKVTEGFSIRDLTPLKVTDLRTIAAILLPGVSVPKTKDAMLELLYPLFLSHSSVPPQGIPPARRARAGADKAADAAVLLERLGALGSDDADSQADEADESPAASDIDEVPSAGASDPEDEDDDGVEIVPDPRAASGPLPRQALSGRLAPSRPSVSPDMFRSLEAKVDRMVKERKTHGKSAAAAASDGIATLVSALFQLQASAASASGPSAAFLSATDRLRESRMVRALFGHDDLLVDVLPDSITADRRRLEDVRQVVESIYLMDGGRPLTFVQAHVWNHEKFKFEALRWADMIQRQLDQVSLDVRRFGDFLLVLKQPVWCIHALIRYDETGEDSYLDAVTPLSGAALTAAAHSQFEAHRKSVDSRRAPRVFRKSVKSSAVASPAVPGAKAAAEEPTPEPVSPAPAKVSSKPAPNGQRAGSSA